MRKVNPTAILAHVYIYAFYITFYIEWGVWAALPLLVAGFVLGVALP